MSTIKSSAENLTLNADGANNDIKFQSNGSEVASIDQAGSLVLSGNLTSLGIDDNADATAITIDSSENVGIGVTDTADAKLVIRSTGVDGTFAPVVSFQYSGNSNEHNSIGSSVAGGAANSGINFKISNGAGSTGQTEIVRITRDGLLFNGDTAAANALDDYEEGTWTPNIGGNATYSNQVGNYIKIGNLVWAHFSMTINVKGTGNSMGAISGLPFPSGYASQNSAAMQWANLATAINHGTYYVGANSTTLYFSYHTGSATGLSNNPNIWANGATMIGVHIYSST
jgi:hypothetical protein